jgi:hypothetical protein
MKGVIKLGLDLSNPKGFLPLLLFIGFVFALLGIGWLSLTTNSNFLVLGGFIIFVAVMLWILSNRDSIGI